MSDDQRVERAVRTALREAAGQIDVRIPGPGNWPERRPHRRPAFRPRVPAAIAAALLAVAALVAVLVLTGRTDEDTVATDVGPPQQVEAAQLGPEEADLVVLMATDATADQVAAVREAIASSPDVVRFAEVTAEQALRELVDAVCAGRRRVGLEAGGTDRRRRC